MTKKFLNVLLEERDEKEAVGFFGNWAKWSIEEKQKPRYDWRYENSVTSGKRIEIDGDYSQWRTNNTLSNHKDSILYANEMNMRPAAEHKWQYEYLLNSLRKRKRYSKWEKEVPDATVEMIMEYYGYGRSKAEQALRVLTDEQLAMIEVALDKGGKV